MMRRRTGCNQYRHAPGCGHTKPSPAPRRQSPDADTRWSEMSYDASLAWARQQADRVGRSPSAKRRVPDLTGVPYEHARLIRASVEAERALASDPQRRPGPITESEWTVAYHEALAAQPWPPPGTYYPDHEPEIDLLDW